MSVTQKTKQRQNANPEEVIEEVVVTETTPTTSTTPERKAGYESLYAPDSMTNDGMIGWRNQLNALNKKYGGDILNYETHKDWAGKNSTERNQYYTDLNNYNSLYNTVANYDYEYEQQEQNAIAAQEYANTRRMLMERYMPETLAAMGYANTGAAGDALLKIQNNYDNYAIGARQQASQNQGDLLTEYRKEAAKWTSERNQEQIEANQAKQELYDDYLSKIYKGEGLDTASLEAAVALGALTPQQKEELTKLAGSWTGDGITYVNGNIPLKQSTADKTVQTIYTYDTPEQADKKLSEHVSVNHDSADRQTDWVTAVLTTSKGWVDEIRNETDPAKKEELIKKYNGLLVDFNYGWTTKDADDGSVYVFYWNPKTNNGEWRLTTLSRVDAANEQNYKDRFYVGKLGDMENNNAFLRWWTDSARGKNFYDTFVRSK